MADKDHQQVKVRFRRQPEDSIAQEVLLTPLEMQALFNNKLVLRELIDSIQTSTPSQVSDVNAVYLWNFTAGLYELADLDRVVEPTHLKEGLIDLIFVWRPTSGLELPAASSTEVADLKNEVASLKELIKEMLKAPVFPATPELQAQISKNFPKVGLEDLVLSPVQATSIRREDLDFAFLYSNPLVARNPQGGVYTLNEPVNFSGECSDIIQRLEEKKKKFNVEIEIATQSEFLKVLRRKPKILHIMCHGSIEAKKSVYFLEFEGENGEQFQMTQDIMQRDLERLGISLDFVDLAFVNSCHSEVWPANSGNGQSSA